jgi:hypothetical protein
MHLYIFKFILYTRIVCRMYELSYDALGYSFVYSICFTYNTSGVLSAYVQRPPRGAQGGKGGRS